MHIYTKRTDITWVDVVAFCNTRVTENTFLDYMRKDDAEVFREVLAVERTEDVTETRES
jgi:uncharacterized protein YehS (DUF1456 family)